MQSQNEVFPDEAVRRKILCLEMKCPVKSCRWKGTLQDFIQASFYSSCDDDAVTITINPFLFPVSFVVRKMGGGEGCNRSRVDFSYYLRSGFT